MGWGKDFYPKGDCFKPSVFVLTLILHLLSLYEQDYLTLDISDIWGLNMKGRKWETPTDEGIKKSQKLNNIFNYFAFKGEIKYIKSNCLLYYIKQVVKFILKNQ